MLWTIAIPAWGDRALRLFSRRCWPSVRAAIDYAGAQDVRLQVHTDEPDLIAAIVGEQVDLDTTPATPHEPGRHHPVMSSGHRMALTMAPEGSGVILLCADMMVSRECLVATQRRFAQGKSVIMLPSIRTYEGLAPAPGLSSRDLLAHAVRHRHHAMWEATWGQGRTRLPSVLLFDAEGSTVARMFHMHPFAIRKQGEARFSRTIDWDLVDGFPVDDLHVVTDGDEMSALELSPVAHPYPVGAGVMTVEGVAAWARTNATGKHRWMFRHRVLLQGDGEGCEDREVVRAVMGRLAEESTDVIA